MKLDDLFYLKVIELVITIICVGLCEITIDITSYEMLIYGTLLTFTIICIVVLIVRILDTELDKDMNGLFSVIGCVLFITSGCLIYFEWHDGTSYRKETRSSALAAGGLMIINGIIFLIDAMLIFRK